jgi:hypothetical protein
MPRKKMAAPVCVFERKIAPKSASVFYYFETLGDDVREVFPPA